MSTLPRQYLTFAYPARLTERPSPRHASFLPISLPPGPGNAFPSSPPSPRDVKGRSGSASLGFFLGHATPTIFAPWESSRTKAPSPENAHVTRGMSLPGERRGGMLASTSHATASGILLRLEVGAPRNKIARAMTDKNSCRVAGKRVPKIDHPLHHNDETRDLP